MQNYISNSSTLEVPLYQWEESKFPKDRLRGNNAKKILVFARTKDIPDHLILLKKILRSVHCDFEQDIAFGTLDVAETFALLSDDMVLENRVLWLFGISPGAVGFSGQAGSGLLQLERIKVIHAPALEHLDKDPGAKRDLWNVLKYVFAL